MKIFRRKKPTLNKIVVDEILGSVFSLDDKKQMMLFRELARKHGDKCHWCYGAGYNWSKDIETGERKDKRCIRCSGLGYREFDYDTRIAID